MPWDLREFTALVEACHPEPIAQQAASAARALARDAEHAAFHGGRVLTLMREVKFPAGAIHESRGFAALHQLLHEASPGDHDRPLARARFEASAHLVSFFRSLHALTDLTAPVVYFGLNLGAGLPKPMPERQLYPAPVREQLHRHQLHLAVADAMDELLNLRGYRYLKALVNTTKHRQLVKAGFTIALDFATDPKHGMQVGRFLHDGEMHESVWAADFLGSEYKIVVSSVINIGTALNAELQKLVSEAEAFRQAEAKIPAK